MFWNTGWGAGGWLLMSLLMLAFWAAVIFGAVWLARNTRHQSPPALPADTPETARRTLDERFARGEITEEEYTRRRELLTSR